MSLLVWKSTGGRRKKAGQERGKYLASSEASSRRQRYQPQCSVISAHEQIGIKLDRASLHWSFCDLTLTCFSVNPIPRFHIRLPADCSGSRRSPIEVKVAHQPMDGDHRRQAAAAVTVTQAARAQDSPARRLIAWLRLLFRECRLVSLVDSSVYPRRNSPARSWSNPRALRFCRGVRS